ncbi:hypothetical protein [Prauserella muralis]|uniref:Uncharacterized protein n=1 Tax=Prauserella muralis TaxID=588067 RepID=A0A2V4B7Y3_9PSEU|nr:hypothetical protein [Prauserella muralis]PXY31368.1 hypothetical protein BAY60_02965 [Prauserella muralis]TWE14309.1 hypothetical protein FHX69_6449 [Prauserella muralis]
MEIVYDVVVVLHLLGMAGILAGVVTYYSAKAPAAFTSMFHSASLQVITGLALVGMASSGVVDTTVNNTKIAVKLAVAVAVLLLALVLWRRKDLVNQRLVAVAGGLTVANVAIAVLW